MAHTFTHSRVVIRQLAQATARTPPSEEDPPFEYIDRSLTILGRASDLQSERMRGEFLSQREFIAHQIKEVEAKVDGGFSGVEKRFEDVEKRFEDVEKRFKNMEEKMDGRFMEVDKKMRRYLEDIQKASRNCLRTRGWEEIYPVGSLDYDGGIQTPDYFPRNIRHFWRLKDPTQSKSSTADVAKILQLTRETVDRLVYLVRFYKIQGYEEWGRDVDSDEAYSDPDASSKGTSESSRLSIPIRLEEAVRSNPDIAHRALGAQLGLAYDQVQSFMERAKELNRSQVVGNKRGRDDQASGERKRRGLALSDLTEVTSPTDPRSSQGRTG